MVVSGRALDQIVPVKTDLLALTRQTATGKESGVPVEVP